MRCMKREKEERNNIETDERSYDTAPRTSGSQRPIKTASSQHTTQHFQPPPVSPFRVPPLWLSLSRYRYPPEVPDGTPSRINMLARVAASNTSSTP